MTHNIHFRLPALLCHTSRILGILSLSPLILNTRFSIGHSQTHILQLVQSEYVTLDFVVLVSLPLLVPPLATPYSPTQDDEPQSLLHS